MTSIGKNIFCLLGGENHEEETHNKNINQTLSSIEELFFNDIFSVYFHDPFDNDWSISSYKLITNISCVKDFWINMNIIKDNITKGLFFFTREHIFPSWEDPENINGYVFSMKILKDKLYSFSEELLINFFGENIVKQEYHELWDRVNLISISPKKEFCIIKIWIKDNSIKDIDILNVPRGYYKDILYKKNKD